MSVLAGLQLDAPRTQVRAQHPIESAEGDEVDKGLLAQAVPPVRGAYREAICRPLDDLIGKLRF